MLYSIKDKNNLLTHNQWSGTSYLKNTNGFFCHPDINIVSSNEWCDVGDYSLKIIGSKHASVDYGNNETGIFDVSLNIHSNYPVRFVLYNSESNMRLIDVPANTNKPVTLKNLKVVNGLVRFHTFIRDGNPDYVYFWDNISLHKR